MYLSDPSFNFKLMSNFKLTKLEKTKSDFVVRNLPPKTDVPIVSFMQTLEEIDNEYNKSLPPLTNNCYNNIYYISCKPIYIFMHPLKV